MASSMTGYGRGVVTLDGRKLQVEIRSVNNRYCELNVRMPRELQALEPALRQQIAEGIARGKLDIQIQYSDQTDSQVDLTLDTQLAVKCRDLFETLGSNLERPYVARVSDLMKLPGLVQTSTRPLDLEAFAPLLEEAVAQALVQLQASRQQEGGRLLEDLRSRTAAIHELWVALGGVAPRVADRQRERLEARLREVLEQPVDEARLLTEVVLLVDKSDVTEELTRLDSHLQLLEETYQMEGPIGKKLDFILQEINREVNTVGSKANDAEMTRLVVDLKCEVEKLREQVQNLE